MTEPAYFDGLYAACDDPWGLTARSYERRKYDITLASLPRRRYRSAFEPGCSVGVLTAGLARRCDAVLAMDGAARAVEQARARVAEPNVRVETGRVPADWPDGVFDLIVVSELLYYLGSADRARVGELALGSLACGGHLAVVDWRHPFAAAPTDGDVVHAELVRRLPLRLLVEHVEDDFVLQVFGDG